MASPSLPRPSRPTAAAAFDLNGGEGGDEGEGGRPYSPLSTFVHCTQRWLHACAAALRPCHSRPRPQSGYCAHDDVVVRNGGIMGGNEERDCGRKLAQFCAEIYWVSKRSPSLQ